MSAVELPAPPIDETRAARRERLRLLVRTPSAVAGALVVVFWIVCAVFGSHVTPYNPIYYHATSTYAHPSAKYWFGTDRIGRDVFSRVLDGSRDILTVAPLATLIGITLGTTLGLITGYLRGIVDDVVSRIIDAVLALPLIIVAVTALAALGSKSSLTVTIVIGVVFAPIIARTVRTAVLSERDLEYVQSARLRGEGNLYVMFVEILPNVVPLILVEATIRLGYAIFAVASLTFIGFGIQLPSPDWAVQINDNYQYLDPDWWAVLFPALAIASLIVAVNLVSDGVQQAYER